MEKAVQVDGLKVRYLEEGRGPAIVLMHGASLGSSADVYEETLPVLAAGGFRTIAYDQPGFGLTDNPKDYTVSYRTAFILKFMDALAIEKACLVGHSQAGGMALRVALEQPRRVSHLVVAGSGSLLPALPDQGGRGQPREGQEGGQTEPTLDDTRKLLEANLFDKSLITPAVLEKRHRMSVGKNLEAFVQRSRARETQKDAVPLSKRLTEVAVPLLMLYGMQDRGSAAKKAALLKENEPGLKVEVIDKASHLIFWDSPEVFHRRVLDFLSA